MHNIPHTEQGRANIRAAVRGKPKLLKRRKPQIIDGIENFQCKTCSNWLPKDAFYSEKRSPIDIKSQCRKCHCKTSIDTRDVSLHRITRRIVENNRRSRLAGCEGVISREEWNAIFAIFGNMCAKCGSTESVEIDHVVPISLKGPNRPTNVQCLCSFCNDSKHVSTADHRTSSQIEALTVLSFRQLPAGIGGGV